MRWWINYELTIFGSSEQTEIEKNARNAQQKMNLQNKCQELIAVGIMCRDKPWPPAENGLTSLLERRGGRTTNPELQKPPFNNRYIVYCGILEDCGSRIHETPEHHFGSSRFLENKTASR